MSIECTVRSANATGTTARVRDRELSQRARRIMTREIAFVPHAEFAIRSAGELVQRALERVSALVESTARETQLSLSASMPPGFLRVRADLLTPPEEVEMFREMNYLKYRANVLRCAIDPRRPEVDHLDDIERLLKLARRLRDRLAEANLRLVLSLARQCAGGKSLFDEAVSEGLFTLLRAIEKFDFSRGYRLSTYATHAIRRSLYRQVTQAAKDGERLSTEAASDIPDRADDREPASAVEARWDRLRGDLSRLLVRLDRRERLVIRARFGLGRESKPQTLQSLAVKLGICKERVRQVEQRALDKLRRLAAESSLADLDR